MSQNLDKRLGYQPIEKAPSLFSINGIGLRLYGKRDEDAETNSYVATRFLTFLYIPTFALGAYRIARTGEGEIALGKSPLSSLVSGWNKLLLLALIGVGGAGYWNSYTSSPDYIAEKNLESARASEEAGEIGTAAKLYDEVYRGGSSFADQGKASLLALHDAARLQAASAQQSGLATGVLSTVPAVRGNLLATVWPLIENNATKQADWSYAVFQAVAPLVEDQAQAADMEFRLLRQLVDDQPQAVGYAVKLAGLYERTGKYEAIIPLLERHRDSLGSTDGARILGQIYAALNRIEEAYQLLLPYTRERLGAFHKAEQGYDQVLDEVWNETIEALNSGQADDSFYAAYDLADEAEQELLIQEQFARRRDSSHKVEAAFEQFRTSAEVVPVALDMGMVMLRRAQTLADPTEQKRELEAAEQTFLAVKGVAGESDDYRQYLAQVYYWLGRPDEGKALFDELLAANNRDFKTSYDVSSILRDLGAETQARELMQEAYDNTTVDEEKYAAASYMSLFGEDAEERIEWLEKADPTNTRVQADLHEQRGHLAARANDNRAAEDHYRKALAVYDTMPLNATTLNNQALLYFSLHAVTQDEGDLEQGMSMIDAAIELDPSSSIILTNAANQLIVAACRDTIGDAFDLSKLRMSASLELLRFLYSNDIERASVSQRLAAHPAFIKSIGYLENAMILAPKNRGIYSELEDLYGFIRYVEGLKRVAGRLTNAGLDLSDIEAYLQAHRRGENDEDYIAHYRRRLDHLAESQADIDPETEPGNYVVVASKIIDHQFSLTSLGVPVDHDQMVDSARRNHALKPSSATHANLSGALMLRGIKALRSDVPQIDSLFEEYDRVLNPRQILTLAMEADAAMATAIAANEDIQAYAELMRSDVRNFSHSITYDEWAFFSHVDPATAAAVKPVALNNERASIRQEIRRLLNPPSAGIALTDYWRERLRGDEEMAAEVLSRAKAQGVPLPDLSIAVVAAH